MAPYDYIAEDVRKSISVLGIKSRDTGCVLRGDEKGLSTLYHQLDEFLGKLEAIRPTPDLSKVQRLKAGLYFMIAGDTFGEDDGQDDDEQHDPEVKTAKKDEQNAEQRPADRKEIGGQEGKPKMIVTFPRVYRDRARALYQRFERDNWGALAAAEGEASEEDDEDDLGPASARARSKVPADDKTIRWPPGDHDIFGEDGIMHGIAVKGRRTHVYDSRYPKMSAKTFGHNGLEVGQWFPRQIVALHRGAHGYKVAGVYGNATDGVYSIVVAGQYEVYDRDDGDALWYTGPGVEDIEDAENLPKPTYAVKALHRSIVTRRVVRVLRSWTCSKAWAPKKGLRYDGLYRVVQSEVLNNLGGGLIERFKLERVGAEEGDEQQPSLKALRKRPTWEERRAYEEIKEVDPFSWDVAPGQSAKKAAGSKAGKK